MELIVDLGLGPADVHLVQLVEGLRGLWEQGELCDVTLMAGGASFPAHQAILAAVSPTFHECLTKVSCEEEDPEVEDAEPEAKKFKKTLVMSLDDISHPEAVQAMLDCIYGPKGGQANSYQPSTEDVNRDVLRLAQRFKIFKLQDQASRWLTSNLSTANVLQRLGVCEEFGLSEVRGKILEQLTANPKALYLLAKDPEIVKVPSVLQDLLVSVLLLLGCGAAPRAAAPAAPPAAPPAAAAAAHAVVPGFATAPAQAKLVEELPWAPPRKVHGGRPHKRAGA